MSKLALDSAYSWTSDRKLWFDIFLDTLDDQDKHLVKTDKSYKSFCFVDGVKIIIIMSCR